MAHLNLTNREYHTITVEEKKGTERSFKIPKELTVLETERILALYDEVDKLMLEPISDESAQLRMFHKKMFGMTTILFQHFEPELTEEYLYDNLTIHDILMLTNFFNSNRYLKMKEEDVKKKLNQESQD